PFFARVRGQHLAGAPVDQRPGLGEDVRALGFVLGGLSRCAAQQCEQDPEKRADPAPGHFCSLRTSPATRICGSTSGFSACSSATGTPVFWAMPLLPESECRSVFLAITTTATIAAARATSARILAIQLLFLIMVRVPG